MRSLRLFLTVLLALCLSTPATAQFKKLRDAVKKSDPTTAASAPKNPAQAEAVSAQGGDGIVVLTPEVVDQLLAGGEAARAERDKAGQEDTPYGRYVRGRTAYDDAKPKCEAAAATWGQRVAADAKLAARYSELTEKAMAAQQKGDMVAYENGMYQAAGVMDPSCAVREPRQPDDFHNARRAVEERANQANMRVTGLTDRELGMASDRVIAILTETEPPGGASASEKNAVSAKDSELRDLYGLREAQADRVAKQTPTPAPVPAAAPAPTVTPPTGAVALNECMVKNVQAHEKEIAALGDRGSAAQQAGNTALMMAIADTIQRIQMAGCK